MDMTIVLELVAFACLMLLSAFFSSSETSLFSLNQLQLQKMRREKDPQIGLIERLLSQPRQLIVTILIGNELVNVAASVISAAIIIQLLGNEYKWVNMVIMVPVLLLVGEITPKTMAIRDNVGFARRQCRLIDLFARAIAPLRWIIKTISEFFITLIVGSERSRANILTEDMVRSLTDEAVGDGALDREEAHYINRIFDFGEKSLRDVMTPRSQIFALPATATLEEAARHYHRTGHTKIPIRGKKPETIMGMLYARDLLREESEPRPKDREPETVADIMRKAFFVPETKPLGDLFYTFRKRKLSLALTIDEFGGVTGLVTMEDLLECIFGEILSGSELKRQRRLRLEEFDGDRLRIDGAMTIEHFNRLTGADLLSESSETIGGLLLDAFGELPSASQSIVLHGWEFTVDALAGQRISGVTVRRDMPPPDPDASAIEQDTPPEGTDGPPPDGADDARKEG